MSFNDNLAIRVDNITKVFQTYENPHNRLKQAVYPKLQNVFGRKEGIYFQEFSALKNVSFEIKKGETVGIVGRNGSGKSTILQVICQTLSPTSGTVETNGRIAALLELGSGFNPEFTGRENVYMNAAILGLSRQETKQRFSEIEKFADIGDFIDQQVKSYSSGMVVRLAFAVAINVDPEVLIVDEALSVGDELFQRKCFSKIEEIKKNGATILFVSHSGATVIELCDRAVLMDGGECIAISNPKDVISDYHKLLYAPESKKHEIKEGIRHKFSDEAEAIKTVKDEEPKKTNNSSELFDPNLKPQSTVEYFSNGARIYDANIYTKNGKKVNNIIKGQDYIYRYKVDFDKHSKNVRFGMLIKTISGVELGGGISASSMAEGLDYIDAGQSVSVEYAFKSSLNTGVYFLNAGVLGVVDDNETYLHRLIDIAMFRVLPEEQPVSTGVIDFECKANIIKEGYE